VLQPGGRLVVISFHSLEDRIVKQFIAKHSREEYDRRAPFAAPKVMKLKALARIKPIAAEVNGNPRSRSADHACRAHRGHGMMRLNLVLLLAVLASALYLVGVQYDSRRLFRSWTAQSRGYAPGDRVGASAGGKTRPGHARPGGATCPGKVADAVGSPGVTTYVTYSAPLATGTESAASGVLPAGQKVNR
jgi:hypothetical protein